MRTRYNSPLKERFAKEADAEKARLVAQWDSVGASLGALELATVELAKDQPSPSDINYWVEKIRSFSIE